MNQDMNSLRHDMYKYFSVPTHACIYCRWSQNVDILDQRSFTMIEASGWGSRKPITLVSVYFWYGQALCPSSIPQRKYYSNIQSLPKVSIEGGKGIS